MNGKLYRCGWCGMPADKLGNPLEGKPYDKVVFLIETYGDYRTHKVHGRCCGSFCGNIHSGQ